MTKNLMCTWILALLCIGSGSLSIACSEDMSTLPQLVPVKADSLEKTVFEGGDCSYPGTHCQKGITTYIPKSQTDSEYENFMDDVLRTNTRNLVMQYGSKEHKVGLKLVNDLLSGKKQLPVNSPLIYDAMHLFDDCLDYACPNLTALSDIEIPNMDQAKIFTTMDGQDILGNVVVRIIARRNTQYFLMTGRVDDPNLDIAMQRCTDSNDTSVCYDDKKSEKQLDKCFNTVSNAQVTCYQNYIKTAPVVEQQTQATTETMLKLFELK